MAEIDPRTLADLRAKVRHDVFVSFTRQDPGARERVEEIVRALEGAGLAVFVDERIDEFEGITRSLVEALAGSRVLLAHYSRSFPGRYACQWELTAAFIAAQRHGDPRERVLVINPEPDEEHIRPIELADARFFPEPVTRQNTRRLVSCVRAKVDKAPGPLGGHRPPAGPIELPERVLRPRLVIGRYPQLWDVHSALHRMDVPAVSEPQVRPAVVISGLAGVGKTGLAEHYAYLFREAFPGGVFWLGPFGKPDFLARYRLTLADIAGRVLGEVPGLGDPRRSLADRFSRGGRVLWIVDGVPSTLTRDELDALLVPSPQVRTILTARSPNPGWDAGSVPLSGLTAEEGLRLFAETRPPENDRELEAVRRFVGRCDGHPFAIRSVAREVRNRPGTLTEEDLRTYPGDALKAVQFSLTGLGPRAHEVLAVAAVLGPAPFAPELVADVLGLRDWEGELRRVADELGELLDRVGAHWQVHDLVSEAVRLGRPRDVPTAGRAAEALLARPSAEFFVDHAEALATRAPAHRIRLLRPLARAYAERGDPDSARKRLDEVVRSGQGGFEDLLGLAEAELGCGHYDAAVRHAQQAEALAPGDHRPRLLVAQALDSQGKYAEADPFWAGSLPDRPEAEVARAVSRRVRGRPKETLAILDRVLAGLRAAPPGPLREDVTPAAKLERARALQLTGKAREARTVAKEVLEHYRERGAERHARFAEAETILADASLTLDLLELEPDRNGWTTARARLRELRIEYENRYGGDNPLTLAAAVNADRALIAAGEPGEALAALAVTGRRVADALGTAHVLWFRIQHALGQGYGQLHEFGQQADLLRPVLPAAERALGAHHPLVLEIRLDLGIALVMAGIGPRDHALELVDDAASKLRETLGGADLAAKAHTAKVVLRLPQPVLRALFLAGDLFGPAKK